MRKRTFAFLTKDSFRVEVKASTPESGYKKLMDIPYFEHKITTAYIQYNENGLASLDSWKSINLQKRK